MIVHIDELLRPLGPRTRELVSEEALVRVCEVARLLPTISGGISLECRLEEGASQVDFMVCCMRSDDGPRALAEALAGTRERLTGPLWDGARAFSREWLEPESLLSRVPIFWLEYDLLPGSRSGVPKPFSFLCVQQDFLKPPGSTRNHPQEVEDSLRLTMRGLEVLRGSPLSPEVARTVTRCFEHLPEAGVVEHVAPLDCRGLDAVRLVIGVPRVRLAEYLERIGWPGPREQVEEIERTWLTPLGFAEVNVDAGKGIAPTIGFSLPLPDDPRPTWASDVLERMVERGLCTPGKRDAVLDWPGTERALLEGHRWPSKMCRTIGLKLVCRPHEPLTVKAYPYFECRFSLWM